MLEHPIKERFYVQGSGSPQVRAVKALTARLFHFALLALTRKGRAPISLPLALNGVGC
jgi:hypothetical protein